MAALKAYIPDPSPRSGPGPLPKKEVQRQKNRLKIADLLLARGADVNRASQDGYSALHLAVRFAGEDAAALAFTKALIKRGARVDAKLDTGITPLHFAVRHQRLRMARILLDAGADPRLADAHGETALQIAEQKGMVDLSREMREGRKKQ